LIIFMGHTEVKTFQSKHVPTQSGLSYVKTVERTRILLKESRQQAGQLKNKPKVNRRLTEPRNRARRKETKSKRARKRSYAAREQGGEGAPPRNGDGEGG